MQAFKGARISKRFSEDLWQALKRLCAQEQVTSFMLLLSAFQTLLHRYTGRDDLVVGSPVAGRTRWETEGLIGFFVNTLALRSSFAGDPSFRELLGRVRETVVNALANQDLPFEKLVEELRPQRTSSYLPIVQVMFALEDADVWKIELPGLAVQLLEVETNTSKFDLTLAVQECQEGLTAVAEYDTDLFEPATIARPDFDPADAVAFWDLTNSQDWHVCEMQQRGTRSRSWISGRYSNQEASVHAFDQMVAERYAGLEFSAARTVRERYDVAPPKEAPIGRLDAGGRAHDAAHEAHDSTSRDPHEHDHPTTGRGSHEHAAARTTARAKATRATTRS